MGWAYCGKDDWGREIGYGITATCDKAGCNKVIDRGLGYICGSMHGGDGGCGRYFCEPHQSTPCDHRFKGAYGATMCQPMKGDDGKVWCACGFDHYVEWPAESENECEKALDFIDLIAQTENVGERLVVLKELGLIATGDIEDVPHPQYGTFGKSEVIRGLVRAALAARKGEATDG